MLTPKQEQELSELLKKYQDGNATGKEAAFVETYYSYFDREEGVLDHLSNEEKETTGERLLNAIHQQIDDQRTPVVPLYRKTIFSVTAAAVLLLVAGAWLFFRPSAKPAPVVSTAGIAHDIDPGRNGAVLHLSNGKTIVLDSLSNGTIAIDKNVSIIKANGAISYTGTASEAVYNQITTDKGRQWQLLLPDGSKVWLNAASSIRYPVMFKGNERLVEITGEAYFEVVHNGRQPFRVKVGNQVIEDIGTAFNVNAYSNENEIRTTLVEGAVKVNGISLSPGQQSRLMANGKISIVPNADVDEAIAWKNGQIIFHGADITTILHAIERWYDVDVTIEGTLPERRFYMEVPRTAKLSELLRGFDVNNIHYTIDGTNNKLVVRP